jgi:hypothetical protein
LVDIPLVSSPKHGSNSDTLPDARDSFIGVAKSLPESLTLKVPVVWFAETLENPQLLHDLDREAETTY